MAQTYNKMKIDIKEPVTDIITAKQNDSNSRFLDVYLYDGGVPIDLTGHEVRIYMLKADGTEVFNNGEITNAAAGRCQFELTDQALGAYGKLLCEISIWYDNVQILTTQTVDIHVVKNLRTAGSIESSNDYGALVVLYQNLYEAIDLMTTMVEQFGEPGEVADAASIATFWQMLEYLYSVNDAALKNASVSEVLDRIGLNTDGAGSGTLFGAVNPLAGLINEVKDLTTSIFNSNTKTIQYVVSDNVLADLLDGEISSIYASSTSEFYIKKWIPKRDGTIKISVDGKTSGNNYAWNMIGLTFANYNGNVSMGTLLSVINKCDALTDGDGALSGDSSIKSNYMYLGLSGGGGSGTAYATSSVNLKVKKNIPVYILLMKAGNTSMTTYFKNLKIYGEEVTV